MDEHYFSERLAQLRVKKKVSAREMSLALGQNESYINHIENKSSYPSMQCFFYICEYLGISPSEFFDDGKSDPTKLRDVYENLTHLDAAQLDIVNAVIKGLLGKKNNADRE
ncbi:MAG: helix-turn-helix domain-containing protein [Oscillospiraceae bacterium]|nr:helix-turn-helix domain-containing protein [Oscillospiraceae bacterium]